MEAQRETEDVQNVYFADDGTPRMIAYRTIWGLLRVIWRANRACKRAGRHTELRIRLPL